MDNTTKIINYINENAEGDYKCQVTKRDITSDSYSIIVIKNGNTMDASILEPLYEHTVVTDKDLEDTVKFLNSRN